MGLLDRFSRVVRSNFGSFVSQSEDPEKILELAVEEMQANLIQLRQAVAQAIATQKRTERQCEQAKSMAQEWYNRAQLALQKGEESIAREALTRRKTYFDTANAMDAQIVQQRDVVAKLKDNMRLLEGKIIDAKTKKDMYIARARSAEASQRIQEMIGQVGTTGAMAAFERMEEQVLNLEARSEAVAELNAGDGLERKFAALEQEPDSIDAQMAAMKANLLAGDLGQERLPPGS